MMGPIRELLQDVSNKTHQIHSSFVTLERISSYISSENVHIYVIVPKLKRRDITPPPTIHLHVMSPGYAEGRILSYHLCAPWVDLFSTYLTFLSLMDYVNSYRKVKQWEETGLFSFKTISQY
jgi:hypothetical protein